MKSVKPNTHKAEEIGLREVKMGSSWLHERKNIAVTVSKKPARATDTVYNHCNDPDKRLMVYKSTFLLSEGNSEGPRRVK
jgi:hypothetical protein